MAVNPLKVPFTNMSFTPDIPSSALGANEYNSGQNVETDVRGINKIAGDQYILSQVPGSVIYVTAGFWRNDLYYFIVATAEGRWYALTGSTITNITPGYDAGSNPNAALSGYTAGLAITAAWNGDYLFINDTLNPPMYLLPQYQTIRFYDTTYGDQTPNVYVWNYETSTYSDITAGFLRLFSAPNVGSILIAGNLQATTTGNTIVNMGSTVRWSQAFGLDSGPITWEPTLTNVANELEVPVRGPVIDGFPLNGNFYVMSYWDTVVFSPIAYTTTAAPVFGVKLLNQGRGLLNENCWANADDTVYGVDARDIWVFNGGNFKSLGNQRVKDWFYSNLSSTYSNRTFMVNNTSKNQIEIYFADTTSTGFCNKMLAYRYDLDVFQAPRDVSGAINAAESPIWTSNVANLSTRTVVYARGDTGNVQLVQKDQGTSFVGNTTIHSIFRRDNIELADYSAKVQVHRILPEVTGTGNVTITVGGADSVGSTPTFKPNVTMPIDTTDPWVQIDQNDNRVVTFKFENNTTTDTFSLTAVNWQITKVEDSR